MPDKQPLYSRHNAQAGIYVQLACAKCGHSLDVAEGPPPAYQGSSPFGETAKPGVIAVHPCIECCRVPENLRRSIAALSDAVQKAQSFQE